MKTISIFLFCCSFLLAAPTHGDDPSVEQTTAALHTAVDFFRTRASAGGGYVYQITADLARREGEGKVGKTTAWIQPPATPAVGMA